MPTEPHAAAAARRATSAPGVYLIPREQLPPGFAERVHDAAGPAAPARPAATVVLLREGAAGPESLLLRRPQRSRFAADAWVFPGGAVDTADGDPALRPLLDGPGAEAWARRLRLQDPAEAIAYAVAALREAWEETGVLLGEAAGAEAAASARAALLASGPPLAELLRDAGARLDTGRLLYIAHWITPEPEPRRYDTRFFAARVEPGTECDLSGDELVESCWVAPADAVERFRRGEMRLLPPTVDTLARLAEHASLERVWSALRDLPVPAVLPRMRSVPGGVEIDTNHGL
jgi:8-oxo-dGTP pyrophosphatase MutT (NUDIX family)